MDPLFILNETGILLPEAKDKPILVMTAFTVAFPGGLHEFTGDSSSVTVKSLVVLAIVTLSKATPSSVTKLSL